MEKYYEVIERTLQLLETLEAGLLHSQNLITNKQYEESFHMIQDITEGISTIEEVLVPVYEEVQDRSNLEFLGSNFRTFLSTTIKCYEEKTTERLEVSLKGTLANYKLWKEELEKTLQPFLLS